MFYNNLYNNVGYYGNMNRTSSGGGGTGNGTNTTGNGNTPGSYTFVMLSKVDHKVMVTTDPYYIAITSNDVTSYSSITYVAQIPTTIFLPEITNNVENIQINIINGSAGLVNVQTQNGELMFNSSYLPSKGAMSTNLTPNKFCKLIPNKTENIFSYILLLA